MSKLESADKHSAPSTLVSRVWVLASLFHGSKLLSAFQLARGHTPSVLGMPSNIISSEILTAHVEREATRAAVRVMRSKLPKTVDQSPLTPGRETFV